MVIVISCLLLGVLIIMLVCLFHVYLWDFNWLVSGSVRSWVSPFECGFLSQRISENYFSCTYFLLLVFFVVFDLEVSLLLNVPLQGVLFKNAGYYYFFLSSLLFGYFYEVERDYVGWVC